MWPLVIIGGGLAYLQHEEQERHRNRAVHLLRTHADWAAELLGFGRVSVERHDTHGNAAGRPHGIEVNGSWLKGRVDLLVRHPDCLHVGLLWLGGHEIQHVVNQDELWRNHATAPGQEFASDEWGAVAVARAGFRRSALRCALRLVGAGCSASHGCAEDRIARSEDAYDHEMVRLGRYVRIS